MVLNIDPPFTVQETGEGLAEAYEAYMRSGVYIPPERVIAISANAALAENLMSLFLTLARIAKRYDGEVVDDASWNVGSNYVGGMVLSFPIDDDTDWVVE